MQVAYSSPVHSSADWGLLSQESPDACNTDLFMPILRRAGGNGQHAWSTMPLCTDFCQRLQAIDLKHGVLPLQDDLIMQLQFSEGDREQGRVLGVWSEIQQRTQCGCCGHVVDAVLATEPINGDAICPAPPLGVLIFPGEQSCRLSNPSRLGLRLACVAEDAQIRLGARHCKFSSGVPEFMLRRAKTGIEHATRLTMSAHCSAGRVMD